MLRHSLEVLARRDPELVERIGWPVDGNHIIVEDSGEVQYRLHGSRFRLSLAPESVDQSLTRAPPAGEIFVFGIGLGEQVDALLTVRPDVVVTAWERDPWLLRLALGRNDWSAALATGRLNLMLGSDLVAAAASGRIGAERGRNLIVHPFLGTVYQNEHHLLAPGAVSDQRPLVALCAGALYTDDLATALRDEGFSVYTLDIHRLAQEELARAVTTLRPAFIAAINYTEGLVEFAAAQGCPLAVWEIDPATSALPPCRGPTEGARIFTYRRANVDEYRAAGFAHVSYLPLGTDPRRRARVTLSPEDRRHYGAPVAFVGSSLMPEAEGFRQAFVAGYTAAVADLRPRAAPGADDAASVMNDVLAAQRQDFSRYLVPAALAARSPDLQRAPPEVAAHLARLLGEIAAAEKRQAYVVRLARLGIEVWGDQGWSSVGSSGSAAGSGESPSTVRYRGAAGHLVELTKIYNASLINLDIGRLYQDDIVTMRVFDVLACGGFVLAERSDALAELFEIGVEVECYRDADQLTAKAAHYLAHPAEARQIAARGQQAVWARHTVAMRLHQILAGLGFQRSEVRR
ncbi:MAG TPA: glycosyltransferase [Polyangia bacterium]|nr:glycosyltransferase [Polyangia bacterium]